MAELDLNTLDRRIAERMMKKGLLSEKEWEKHLKGLSDLGTSKEPKFEAVTATLETGVLRR